MMCHCNIDNLILLPNFLFQLFTNKNEIIGRPQPFQYKQTASTTHFQVCVCEFLVVDSGSLRSFAPRLTGLQSRKPAVGSTTLKKAGCLDPEMSGANTHCRRGFRPCPTVFNWEGIGSRAGGHYESHLVVGPLSGIYIIYNHITVVMPSFIYHPTS